MSGRGTKGKQNPAFSYNDDGTGKLPSAPSTQDFTMQFTSRDQLFHKDKKDNGSVELGVLKKHKEIEANNDYDPFANRIVEHPTTNSETLFHLLKGSLGTGILAMPLAFKHSGYIIGILATFMIGALCTYCIQMLIKTEYILCKRRKVPSLTYPGLAEVAFEEGPSLFQKCSKAIVHITNAFLLTYQLGTCCVYTVFIADNIKDVADRYVTPMDVKLYMLMILLPLILINYIRNLKLLAPFSTLANFITLFTFGIILYYLFQQEVKFDDKEAFGTPGEFPLFFGTVLFALEAIGVIMPLENEMKTPKSFGGPFGVLNIGMVSIVFMYVGMGLLGYLAYGEATAGTITLNIGDDIMAQVAKILLSLAIYITHALQCYVAIDITWNEYLYNRFFEKSRYQLLWEYVIRTCLVLITFCLAVAVPYLELFISLFGALCLSALGLAIPALIEISATWYTDRGLRAKIMFAKNLAIIAFGIIGLVTGTYVSLQAIIAKFQEEPSAAGHH